MAKRKGDNSNLGDAIHDFIGSNRKLSKGLDKVVVKDAWNEVMGNAIAKYTTQVVLERETLYIQLSSSVLREELSYGKDKIIKLLNEEIGKEMVQKLVLR